MHLIIYLVLAIVIAVIYGFSKLKKRDRAGNCFLKMACTGKPVDPPVTDEEIHDILRDKFHPSFVNEHWDAIVIGSGLSGLTVAKILSAAGRKVLVLEQHDRAGGSCHTFKLDKYEFDVGLHYVQDMLPGKQLYRICSAITDSQVQWQKIPYDFILIGDKQSYARAEGDNKHFCEQLKSWFPDEAQNIDRYFDFVLQCLSINLWWLLAVKMIPLLLVRLLHKFGLINLLTNLFKYCELNLLEVMKQYKLSPNVQAVISYYFVNYGAPPNRASFFQHHLFLMKNGNYPIGGTPLLCASIVRAIQKFGGKVLVKADVQGIVFTASGDVKGVVLNYGSSKVFIPSALAISTVSVIKLFNELIPRNIAQKSAMFEIVNRLHSLEAVRCGGFQAYIGLSGSQHDLQLSASNYFWLKNNNPYEIDHYAGLSLPDALDYGCPPFMYITFPSAKDPSWDMRNPGTSTCQIISFVNPAWFEEFKDPSKKKTTKRLNPEEYEQRKNHFGEMIFNQLLKLFPEIKPHIAHVEYSTPLSQQYYMQNVYGEYYSLTQQIDRFKLSFWSELRCETDLPGLYLSGQDALFCGIGSVLNSGLLTAGRILKRDLYNDLDEAYKIQMSMDRKAD